MMDGGYVLRHKKRARTTTLAVRGSVLEICEPPAAKLVQAFDSHPAAVEAMSAELVRLMVRGWSIADVQTDPPEGGTPAAIDPHPFDPAEEAITRSSGTVTVDAREAEVTPDQARDALKTVFPAGCAELVISGGQPCPEPWWQSVEPWCMAAAGLGSSELERFVVDTFSQPLTRQARVRCGDLTQLFRSFPRLSTAFVIGCADLESLAHEYLEDLTLMGEPIGVDTLRAVIRGPAPRLGRLALGFAYETSPAPGVDAALLAALEQSGLPRLTELHIACPEDGAALLDGLVQSPIFARLRVLSIDGDVLKDEERGLALLRKHRAVLSKLDALYLPIDDVLSQTDVELRALIPGLRGTDEQRSFSPGRHGPS